jgi:hypothetical protein
VTVPELSFIVMVTLPDEGRPAETGGTPVALRSAFFVVSTGVHAQVLAMVCACGVDFFDVMPYQFVTHPTPANTRRMARPMPI